MCLQLYLGAAPPINPRIWEEASDREHPGPHFPVTGPVAEARADAAHEAVKWVLTPEIQSPRS